jgi:putative salt-induced outer membrane protein YdiY
MKSLVAFVCSMAILLWAAVPVRAEGPDVVTLKDGSIVHGEVIDMEKGELIVKTVFGVADKVKIKWANVAKLVITHPVPFHLKEGTVLVGTAQEGEPGMLVINAEPMTGSLTVPMEAVVSINPLAQPPVIYQGAFTGGLSANSGNTKLTNFSLLLDFTGRSETLRLTLFGRYIYGENSGEVIARNSRGTVKLDFFPTKRGYIFTSAYFEQDTFQDLKLRTALTGGPGYQLIDVEDLSGPYLKDMTLSGEAGVGYFNEDFKQQEDTSSFRGRVTAKLNWPMSEDKVTIYHFSEFFPSLQNSNDYYLTADQGIRFQLFKGFVAGFQLTYRYNNKPPAGVKNSDTLYVFTLGYGFDTSLKR